MATFKVTNDAGRIAICTIVGDGHSDTYLKIRPGKTAQYAPKRQIQLVCDRATKLFWPIKLGASYRRVDGERRLTPYQFTRDARRGGIDCVSI